MITSHRQEEEDLNITDSEEETEIFSKGNRNTTHLSTETKRIYHRNNNSKTATITFHTVRHRCAGVLLPE